MLMVMIITNSIIISIISIIGIIRILILQQTKTKDDFKTYF